MAGKIQKQDVKTETELTGAGATAADLINDTQIYTSAASINKTLDDAIVDGDVVRPDAVTNAKLANMATQTIKGRTTAGTGDPEDLSATQATAVLNNMVGDSGSGGTKGLVPAPAAGDATKFLKGNGTWSAPGGASLNNIEFLTSNTWTVPSGVNDIEIFSCGGGGGGGGSGGNAGNLASYNGGGGGGGAGANIYQMNKITVVPGDLLTITIGAGGSGGAAGTSGSSPVYYGSSGGLGGNTTIVGTGINLTFFGGAFGGGGAAGTAANQGRAGDDSKVWQAVGGPGNPGSGSSGGGGGGGASYKNGGDVSTGLNGAGGSGNSAGTGNGFAGGPTIWAPTASTGGVTRGGGGGGNALGQGGNGGNSLTIGGSASANSGAGGGGGGGRLQLGNGVAGGAGGSGYLKIYWIA